MKRLLILSSVLLMALDSLAAKAVVKKEKGGVTLANGVVSVAFDEAKGTFTIRDAKGVVRLADAGVGATSALKGAHFSVAESAVRDVLGSGVRLTFTVRDDSIGARWGFYDAGYQHAHSLNGPSPVFTYTLYDDNPALVASFGMKTPKWYRHRLREATVLRGGRWLPEAQAKLKDVRTINHAAGAEPAHLLGGLTRCSANGVLVTGLVDGKRATLVAGGLQYDAFGKYAELVEGALTLYAKDEVGVLLDPPSDVLFAHDTFYIDAVTDDPFVSAETYGRAMRLVNGCDPNVYDFPLLCGWAVGALSHLGNINNSPALVHELDLANEKGFTQYSKVGVRLEPDSYCYGANGNTEQGWYDDAHWSKFGHLRAPYETFAKWCAALKERHGIPYTYFQVGMPSHDFERLHSDWMLFNSCEGTEKKHMHHQPFVSYDMTDPRMADHMLTMWKRLRKDGMCGIKFDYPETGYRMEGGFDDIHASAVQVYRKYFALAREGLGKEAFLDERNLGESGRPCLDATAGIVDTQRTWSDSNKFDPRMITTDGLRWFKMRTVFNYYPDSKAIHGINANVRRSLLTTVYLTSGRLELATSFRLFTPEMTRDLSRLYPEYREPFAARPIDAFVPGTVNPRVYDLELTKDWHEVMFFNPENRRDVVKAALCGDRATAGALGLDPASKWRVHSFWDDLYFGILGAGDTLAMKLGRMECEMFRVTRAANHPQVVSTTRHLLQGWMDVADETWNAASRTLSGVAKHLAAKTTESVVLANDLPDGTVMPFVAASVSAEDVASGVKVAVTETNGTVRLAFTTPVARPIRWAARFGAPVQGKGLKPLGKGVVERPSTEPRDAPAVKPGPVPPPPTVRIETLKPLSQRSGWGNGIRLGRGYDGVIQIGKKKYKGGMAIHANGEAVFARKPEWKRVVAVVGIDEHERDKDQSSAVFKIIGLHPGGESELATSPVVRFGGTEEWHFDVAIPDGVMQIKFVVTDAGDNDKSDHGDWGDCGFVE